MELVMSPEEMRITKSWLFADCGKAIHVSGIPKEQVWEWVRDGVITHEEVRSGILGTPKDRPASL